MISNEEKLKNLQEFRKEVIQRISGNDELIKIIDSIDSTLGSYLVMLTAAEKYPDDIYIKKIKDEWYIVKN